MKVALPFCSHEDYEILSRNEQQQLNIKILHL